MNQNISLPTIALAAYAALAGISQAQVIYNTANSTYSENFDTPVGVSGNGNFTWTDDETIPGWFSQDPAAGIESQFPGGISATQRVYSFRYSAADDGAGSGRAFGTRTTSAGTFSFALGITNNTGSILTEADFSFVSAIWRTPVDSTSDSLSVGYAITTAGAWTSLTYTSVNDLSSSYTQGASGGGTNTDPNTSGLFYDKSTTITGLNWANGDTLYLRFVDGTGSAAWGIDNLAFTAIPEPSTSALIVAGLATMAIFRRRRQQG